MANNCTKCGAPLAESETTAEVCEKCAAISQAQAEAPAEDVTADSITEIEPATAAPPPLPPKAQTKATKSTDGPERRKYVRIPTVVPVVFQFVSKASGPLEAEIRTGFTQDLSASGLCLQTGVLPEAVANYLEKGELDDLGLNLDLAMPDRSLRIGGRIAWRQAIPPAASRRFAVGVEFLKLDPKDAAAVAKYAKRSARKPKLFGAAIVGLLILTTAAIGLFLWGTIQRQDSELALRTKLSAQNSRQQALAQSLEQQTTELESVSKLLREIVTTQEELGGDSSELVFDLDNDGAKPDNGELKPATAVETLKTDIEKLRDQITALNTKIRQLKDTQDAKKKGKSKPGKASKVR